MKKWIILILGTIAWSLTMIKSGWMYAYGMGFWGANGHDGIWHIALSESLSRGNLDAPVFSGAALQNYHIGFDLLLALIHKLTFISTTNLYFQVFPPVFAFLIGLLTYKFVKDWTDSESSAIWSTFFVYFGGSLAWILGRGESAFWSTQAISTLINPPFALSLIFILVGLISLLKKKYFWASVCFGVLIEIKAYAGILALGSLLISGFYMFIKEKKLNLFYVFLGSVALSLVLYLPLNKNSAGLLVWQPFWFLETMMGLSDRLGWDKFYSAMNTYKTGHVWLKLIPAYLLAFIIFWAGNMGTRLGKEILILKWIKNLKKISWIEVFISVIIIGGGVIPMFFLQKGTPWNTIQFFYYSLFFSGILAGIATSPGSRFVKTVAVFLTIPTTIFTLKEVYIPSRPPAMVSNNEISALRFLSKEPTGVVLTYPFDSNAAKLAEANPPRPLYLYASTGYVSAFSKHPTFLEDEINLDITGYNWVERRAELVKWYKEKDQAEAKKFLKDNGIKYVYWVKPQRALLGESQLGLKNIFENKEIIIYQVD